MQEHELHHLPTPSEEILRERVAERVNLQRSVEAIFDPDRPWPRITAVPSLGTHGSLVLLISDDDDGIAYVFDSTHEAVEAAKADIELDGIGATVYLVNVVRRVKVHNVVTVEAVES